MSSLHLKRAKAWQTTEFNTEWIQNAVEYCRKDPEGKRRFEAELVANYEESEARKLLLHFSLPGARRISGSPPKGDVWWAQAVFDLGMPTGALVAYAQYVQRNGLAAPPHLKPAIKRKRGEGSIAWLSRRYDAHMDGHKVPEMDWATARAIAISEFDRARDTWEGWHTSPERFFDEIHQRGITTILSPQILADPDKDWVRRHKFDDAFRGRVYSLTMAHMVWLHASELLEELFSKGLTTSAEIEREYKKDRQLMMRLIACYVKIEGLSLHLWSNMGQVLSNSENIAPCLIRRRGAVDGMADISMNNSPAGKTCFSLLNDLEQYIVRVIVEQQRFPMEICEKLMKFLVGDPHAADRFDSGTFDILGEFLTVHEFLQQMELSTFGKNLMACSLGLEGTESDLLDALCPMKPRAVQPKSRHRSRWGAPYITMVEVRDTWRDIAWRLNMQGTQGSSGLLARIERMDYLPPAMFDDMWHVYDLCLWVHSAPKALPGQHRALARHFGLYEVSDSTRPTCTGVLLREMVERTRDLRLREEAPRHAAAAARAQVPDPVVVVTVAQSGHAYLADEEITPREKVKTRKHVRDEAPEMSTIKAEGNEGDILPEFLPLGYKLGKKAMKVFHRILEDDRNADETTSDLKKGQIRWDRLTMFQAMKRIGFGVCQTAGSTVRFDPPAKNARPITFHRVS
ncbi:hypothetical protein DFH07DRAFT_912106 [Mycena maculata]|uniref:Uncharacterized protein n=1 Tax=Mycena maculata TaxID=230809 RepID=A0AAD7K343_9AGAR|nr:hypothetical protein DFH07DRAFT_912106 [Mycena maculata]